MSTKQLVYNMIDNLTEEQLNALFVVLRGWEIENDVPNDKTLKAFAEIEEMKKNPQNYKSYYNAEEIVKDILNEI